MLTRACCFSSFRSEHCSIAGSSRHSLAVNVLQAVLPAVDAAGVCVPCLFFFFVVMAGFAGLLVGSLYYGGHTLQSLWALGRQRGLGLREVALQGFKRGGVDRKIDGSPNEEHESWAESGHVGLETQRLIDEDR